MLGEVVTLLEERALEHRTDVSLHLSGVIAVAGIEGFDSGRRKKRIVIAFNE